MTYYEKITATPAALGAFLTSLPVLDAPWDRAFQQTYCAECPAEDCDNCPHQEQRNNPAWFLAQEAVKDGHDL